MTYYEKAIEDKLIDWEIEELDNFILPVCPNDFYDINHRKYIMMCPACSQCWNQEAEIIKYKEEL